MTDARIEDELATHQLILQARNLREASTDWRSERAYHEIRERLTEDYHDLCAIRERARTAADNHAIADIEDLYPHLRTTPDDTRRLDALIDWLNARYNLGINRHHIDLEIMKKAR